MNRYIHQLTEWPDWRWDRDALAGQLAAVHIRQGKLSGKIDTLGLGDRVEAELVALTQEIQKSSEIEGEYLDADQVRSSIARRLGLPFAGVPVSDQRVEGVVEMMLDATQKYADPLTKERLFAWHGALFPTGRSGLNKINVGAWRDDSSGPMQVVSGARGQHVHFEAVAAFRVESEMKAFLEWFEGAITVDPVIKAALAHLWFVTIHPFDDGNGRMARAIADVALARWDGSSQRFYSMSAQIRLERNAYYDFLEKTQKGNLDVTAWIEWFLGCLDRALARSEQEIAFVLKKAEFWRDHTGADFNPRQRLILNKLFDGFEGKLTSSKWAKIAKCSPDTALRDITELVEQGILVKDQAGGRSTSYFLPALTTLG